MSNSKGDVFMNRIFKVIWSKTKHCYIVVSEYAKANTKAAHTGLRTTAAAVAAAAMLLAPVNYNYVWAADTATVTDTNNEQQTVYTKDGADSTLEKETKAREAADAEIKQSMTDQKTDKALHVSKDGNLIVGTKEQQTVKDLKIRGQMASNSISTGAITATGDATVKGKVEAEAVYDDTTKTGNYVVQTNSVGANLSVLDTQVKANADAINEEAKKRKYSVTNLEKADAAEAAAREAKDNELNERITNEANAIHETTNQLQSDLNTETADRKTADNELNERITNEANAIHETTHQLQNDLTTETTAREAADTALDTRITNVKEYLEKQTSDNYVSKADAAVQDGAIVKAANTIGENVTNLDAALAKETAARIGADKAQDKVIQQVNQNMVEGFNTINKNMFDGFTALSQADTALDDKITAETASRVVADTKLVEAVNSGVSLSKDNVLQKNTTTIDAQGNVTTSKTDAKEMILNKGNDNQITLNEKGIKVGTNSSVMDANGVYTGGDNYTAAKAAMSADGSIKGASGDFTVDGTNGNVNTKGSVSAASGTIGNVSMSADGTMTGVKDLTASGKITADSFTDGTATMSNGSLNGVNQINATGNIVTTGNMQAHDMTATGTITGQNINGTTGTFGSLTTTGNASVGGALTANGITNTGNTTTDSLTVKQGATVGGNLAVTGDITGKSLNVGTGDIKGGQISGTGLDVGAGTIKTTGAVETGTLTTTGDADIGGNLTVDKNLTVNGEFNAKTLSSKLDENNYTTINGGKTESVNLKIDVKTHETQASASTFDETGSNAWAKDDDSIGESSMTADKISQSLSDTGDNTKNIASRELSQNTDNKYEITDSVVEGNQSNVENRTADTTDSQISLKDDSGKVLNKSYITQNLKKVLMGVEEGGNKTTIEQDANNITNTAENGTISNSAKDLVNTASENMTNNVGKNLETTVGGEMKTTVTGKVTEDFKSDLITTIGGNKSETVAGTSEETVTGKKTETYGGLETTVNGDEKHTVSGSQTNEITGSQTNTIGGDQTTTVTGDSSLTAENISNEAKNKITNKALDVETDASSSIVNKVSNEYGSNTSTQLSYQTTEEMSQADGKTASYLRGAAEEKSQLTDGDQKTTIDTVAGQTNTNITDGTNTSNSLQKADQVDSSVTDGTNTTVVSQDATSLASSITDGTKANNTNNTVDKSEQLIKASDTQYSATTKTATKTEDALVSGSNIIDVIKGLDAAGNPLISSVVTNGTNTTGVTQTATDITNAAQNGTIANTAKNIINKASENMTNTVGKDLTTTVGGEMKTTVTGKVTEDYKSDLDTKVGGNETHAVTGSQTVTVSKDRTVNVKGTEIENFNAQVTNIKTDQRTSVGGDQSTTVTGNQTNSITGDQVNTIGGNQITTVTGDSSLSAKNITNTGTESVTNQVGSHKVLVNTEKVESAFGDNIFTTWDESGITNTAKNGTISNTAKDILNDASGDIINMAAGEIGNTATKITNITGDTTVTSDTNGTVFENKSHNKPIDAGTITKTTISGNTLETGKATMDYAEVMKDLGVRGNAVIDQTLTVKGDSDLQGNAAVGKDLTVKGNSDLQGDATVGKNLTVKGDSDLQGNATVGKNLTVGGTSTFHDKVTVAKGGLEVTGGTQTDALHVTGASNFDGMATFKDIVTMEKDLSVGGNATVAGDVTASSYKVGDKTYIDENGINANGQKITNVAAGTEDGDAANYGQLRKVERRVDGVENRVTNVESRVDKMDSRIDKVGANAAAMANLHPLEFDEDSKWNVAAAVGNYKGETAAAVGAFYRPNEDVMFNLSTTFGNDENMVGGGLSLRLGKGGNHEKDKKLKAAIAENNDLRAKVDDLTARMDALLSVINPNMSKEFPDVPENHWAYEAVTRLAGNDIVQGYEDGKFHGERTMTRYEMAEIIYNALSKGAKAEKKLVEEFKPELQAMVAQKQAK